MPAPWAQQGWEQEVEVSAPCSPSEGAVTWAAARASRGQALQVKEVLRITCGSDPQLLESLGMFCWCQWMADKQCRSVSPSVSLACVLAASNKRILQGCKVHFGSK